MTTNRTKPLGEYEALKNEVLARATDVGTAATKLRTVAKDVARHANESKDWAPDLAAPRATYLLAKDAYDAILELYHLARSSSCAFLADDSNFAVHRAFYDAAFPPAQ